MEPFTNIVLASAITVFIIGTLFLLLRKPKVIIHRDTSLKEALENRIVHLENESKHFSEDIGSLQTLLSSKEKDLFSASEKVKELEAKLAQEEENSRRILSMKKSSEIRTGHIAEQLAPFLTGFDHDPRNIRYLGQPIDYVIFDKDAVIFLEVKSGRSHLSHNQKRIRKLIEDKKVRWEEFRVSGKTTNRNTRFRQGLQSRSKSKK